MYIRRLPSLKIIIQLYNDLGPIVSHGSGGNKPENPFSRTTWQHNVHERRTADWLPLNTGTVAFLVEYCPKNVGKCRPFCQLIMCSSDQTPKFEFWTYNSIENKINQKVPIQKNVYLTKNTSQPHKKKCEKIFIYSFRSSKFRSCSDEHIKTHGI